MDIIGKIKNTFSKTNNSRSTSGISGNDFLRNGNRRGVISEDWSSVSMSDMEYYNGYSYAAINNRANKVAQVATENISTEADQEFTNELIEQDQEVIHPYLKLINNSDYFTPTQFWYDASTYLDLEGVYYILVVRNVKDNYIGAPQYFQLLNPYEIQRVINRETMEVGGYIENRNGLMREIPKEMIIEIRKLNPFSRERPFAMTDAAKEFQFALKQANDYTRSSLRYNVSSPGIISTDVVLEPENFINFRDRVQGSERGAPIFANGAKAVSWQPMNVDMDKAALSEINEINRSTVFAVSGVSKTTMGIEESGTTRETSRVQKDKFIEDHIMPQIKMITDALNQDYKKYYKNEWNRNKYNLYLENPLSSDVNNEISKVKLRSDEYYYITQMIQVGYEYDVAAKFISGEISVKELGEPTLERELSYDEILAIANYELEQESSQGQSQFKQPTPPTSPTSGSQEVATAENFLELKTVNSGYNPYRDPKSGQFTDAPFSRIMKSKGSNRSKIDSIREQIIAERKQAEAPQPVSGGSVSEDEQFSPAVDELYEYIDSSIGRKESGDPHSDDIDESFNYMNEDEKQSFIDEHIQQDSSYEDSEIISEYVGKSEYKSINEFLRNPSQFDRHPKRKEELKILTERVKRATNADTVRKDFSTYRSGMFDESYVDNLTSGSYIEDNGIISTSLDAQYSNEFGARRVEAANSRITDLSDRQGAVLFRMNHSAGNKGIYADSRRTAGGQEFEWIPAHGSQFRISETVKFTDSNGDFIGAIVDVDVYQGDIPKGYVQIDMFENNNASLDNGERFVWVKDNIRILKMQDQEILNASEFHNHSFDKTIEVKNRLDENSRESLGNFESSFMNAITQWQILFAASILNNLDNNVDFSNESNIITRSQKNEAIFNLNKIVRDYYNDVLPYYANEEMRSKNAEYGTEYEFHETPSIRRYIDITARKASESYVDTLIRDVMRGGQNIYESTLKEFRDGLNLKRTDETSEEIFEEARRMALEGPARGRIIRSLTERYETVGRTRAKTIARTESNRVFSQSQYFADLQFLNNHGLMHRAYKRWVTRSNEPCEFCLELASRGPVPFEEDFVPFGSELSYDYHRKDGKVTKRILKFDYEPVVAGNAHVNCGCRYELVIRDENGQFINILNAMSKDYEGLRELVPEETGYIMVNTDPIDIDGLEGLETHLSSDIEFGNYPGKNDPHITLLDGVLKSASEIKETAQEIFNDNKIPSVTISKIDFFETDNGKVLIAKIRKNKKLTNLREAFTLIPHASKFPEYNPHISIAYVDDEFDIKKAISELNKTWKGKKINLHGLSLGEEMNIKNSSGYNPYRDPKTGQFDDAPFSKKMVDKGSNRKKIDELKKNTKIDSYFKSKTFYHGTSGAAAKSISDGGFNIGKGEDRYGSGIYFASDSSAAQSYGKWKENGKVISVKINSSKPYRDSGSNSIELEVRKKMGNISDMALLKRFGEFKKNYADVVDSKFRDGYDSIIIKDSKTKKDFIIVRDSSLIEVGEIKDAS